MTNLSIADTKNTPEIKFDAASGKLDIIGESYPESAMTFYQQVLDWLKQYLPNAKTPVVLTFRLSYFNTSSSKCILNIINLMEEAHASGKSASVNWYYQEDDEDMKDSGDEFAEGLSVPFKILSY